MSPEELARLTETFPLQDKKQSSQANQEAVDAVVTTIADSHYGKDKKMARAAIALLCQRGATNTNTGSKVQVKLGEKDKANILRASDLQSACKKHGITVRQMARTMRSEIHQFAKAYKEEGDLTAQYLRDNPDMTEEDKYWCSNFQSENPECPQHIREWLLNDYKRRFNR